MSAVLLSAAEPPAGVRDLLSGAGLPVIDHVLGAVPPVEFGGISAALVDVGDHPDAAAAQTRRWRAELGDDLLPLIWILPKADERLAARGLDAGADAVLIRPLDSVVLLAQVRSADRARTRALRLAARAAESRILGEHLKRAHDEADRAVRALRRVRLAFLERSFPDHGPVRLAVSHRPRGKSGGDFYGVSRLNDQRIAIVVGDVIGPGPAGDLIGHLASRIADRYLAASSAGEALAGVNRELLALGLDDLPLVAMLIGILNTANGELGLARAGLPAPVLLPADGGLERWPIPGPFLGTGNTAYATQRARLRAGDRLLIGTDGIRPDGNLEPGGGDQLLECAERNRELTGQLFVDAVARDLLGDVRHEDDFTLLVVEMAR
jgi:sigma-B regulation protein RsbU (phosphoserine phosphatase)